MLRHVSYAREHCATLRSKPAVAFGPSTFSSPWSIRVLPMLRCPAHAWEARQQRAWPGSMQQLHAASDSHADSGAQTQTVAQPRDAPASATSTESLTQPMLTGAEASADLYGKWWTCAGWEALPKHVDLPNVHPGITKSDFYRVGASMHACIHGHGVRRCAHVHGSVGGYHEIGAGDLQPLMCPCTQVCSASSLSGLPCQRPTSTPLHACHALPIDRAHVTPSCMLHLHAGFICMHGFLAAAEGPTPLDTNHQALGHLILPLLNHVP